MAQREAGVSLVKTSQILTTRGQFGDDPGRERPEGQEGVVHERRLHTKASWEAKYIHQPQGLWTTGCGGQISRALASRSEDSEFGLQSSLTDDLSN